MPAPCASSDGRRASWPRVAADNKSDRAVVINSMYFIFFAFLFADPPAVVLRNLGEFATGVERSPAPDFVLEIMDRECRTQGNTESLIPLQPGRDQCSEHA